MERERRPLLRRSAQDIRLSRKTKLGLFTILSTETLERVAFYGIVGNLVLFLNLKPLVWMSYNAASALFIFTGVSYLSSIFAGWLADSYLGKFRSIVLFMSIYLGGYVFFPALAWDSHSKDTTAPSWCNTSSAGVAKKGKELWQESCSWAVFLSLFIMGVGIGGVKSNIAAFGADQVKQFGPITMRAFFNWFYWCINIGALLSLGILAYIQQQVTFKWGYIVPNICLALALLIFITGSLCYVKKPPGGSVLSSVCKVLCEACRRSKSSRTRRHRYSSVVDSADPVLERRSDCLDAAKVRYGGSFHDNLVDDVKTLGSLLVVFLSLVPYWAVYFQMETTYPIQGFHMKLDFRLNGSLAAAGNVKFNIPAAWLSLFDVIFLLFLIPLFDRVIYPKLDKTGHSLSLRGRIIIGMCCGAASVLVAGGLEMYRLSKYWSKDEHGHWHKHPFYQIIGNTTYNASDVSVLAQIPQYALIGISEVFASVAGLELAYTSAPRSMVSLIMGLFWFSQGLGSFLGTALIRMFRNIFFFSEDFGDINCKLDGNKQDIPVNATDADVKYNCHLDYYFFVLAGLQVLATILFIVITGKLGIGRRQPVMNSEPVSPNRSPRSTFNDSGIANESSGYSADENSPEPVASRNRRNIQGQSNSSSTASDASNPRL